MRTLHRLDVHLNLQCLRFVFTIYRQEKFPIGGTMGEFVVGAVPMELQALSQIPRASDIKPVEFLRSKYIDYVHPKTKKATSLRLIFAPPLGLEPTPIAIGALINSRNIFRVILKSFLDIVSDCGHNAHSSST